MVRRLTARDRQLRDEIAPVVRRHLRRKVPAREVDDVVQDVLRQVVEALAITIADRRIADATRARGRAPGDEGGDVTALVAPSPAAVKVTAVVAVEAARRELAAVLGRWTDDDDARAHALATLHHGRRRRGDAHGWRNEAELGRLLVIAHGGPPRTAEQVRALARGYQDPIRVAPAMVDEEHGIWLVPKATRRRSAWPSIVLALAAESWPPVKRPLDTREIALAAVACGWIVLTDEEAVAAIPAAGRRWSVQIDTVDAILERSGTMAVRRARAEHPEVPSNVLALPMVNPALGRRGRSTKRRTPKS